MANQARLGFYPVGSQTRAQPRRYTLASGYAPINGCLGVAPGEVVSVAAAGNGQVIIAAPTSAILGVVASVSYKDASGVRVFGGYVPTGTTYTGDSSVLNPNAPIIEVWDDPGIEYIGTCLVNSGTPLTEQQKVFANMDLSATSALTVDTVYKRSLRTLTGTENTTATFPFRVLAMVQGPAQDYSATSYLKFKVMINNGFHSFFQATGV
jgi:hypothetical protein